MAVTVHFMVTIVTPPVFGITVRNVIKRLEATVQNVQTGDTESSAI
jgi:hypothetical protein